VCCAVLCCAVLRGGAVIQLESSKGMSRRRADIYRSVGSNDSLIIHLPKASPEIVQYILTLLSEVRT